MDQQLDIDGPSRDHDAEFENFLDSQAYDPEMVEAERIYWERKAAQEEERLGPF